VPGLLQTAVVPKVAVVKETVVTAVEETLAGDEDYDYELFPDEDLVEDEIDYLDDYTDNALQPEGEQTMSYSPTIPPRAGLPRGEYSDGEWPDTRGGASGRRLPQLLPRPLQQLAGLLPLDLAAG
jgi:hypothetical protein